MSCLVNPYLGLFGFFESTNSIYKTRVSMFSSVLISTHNIVPGRDKYFKMKYVVIVICLATLGHVLAAPIDEKLVADIDDIFHEISHKVGDIVFDYLAYDKGVKEFVDYMNTDEFKMIIRQIDALPEYRKLLDYLESVGLPAYKYVNAIHTIVGVEGIPVDGALRPTLTGGVKGMISDINAVVPRDKILSLVMMKTQQSPQLREVLQRFQGEEFRGIIEKLFELPEFEALQERLELGEWRKKIVDGILDSA